MWPLKTMSDYTRCIFVNFQKLFIVIQTWPPSTDDLNFEAACPHWSQNVELSYAVCCLLKAITVIACIDFENFLTTAIYWIPKWVEFLEQFNLVFTNYCFFFLLLFASRVSAHYYFWNKVAAIGKRIYVRHRWEEKEEHRNGESTKFSPDLRN